METLSWARRSRGPAVSRLQELLNAAGFGPVAVDGVFGSATHNAVLALQAARGLRIDGIAGPQTWAALGSPDPGQAPSGETPAATAARGWSVHIGVNRVDPAHYGTSAPLHGCENDALAMEALAERSGFTTRRRLLTTDATSAGVVAALDEAARTLVAGDLLLLTYAGHGAQLPDLQAGQEESDRLDETWCLYDRQFLDDELAALWGRFRPGVRILMLSDSCHSGTMSRATTREVAIVKEIYYANLAPPAAPPTAEGLRALDGLRAYLDSVPLPRGVRPADGTRGLDGAGGALVTRNLPQPVSDAVAQHHREVYANLQRNTPRADPSAIGATIVLLSGCQDNQLSQESGGRGRFSVTLEAVLAEGAVPSHPELHRRIVARMPPTQTPNYSVVGAPNPAFEAQAPFTVAAARGGVTTGGPAAERAKMAV